MGDGGSQSLDRSWWWWWWWWWVGGFAVDLVTQTSIRVPVQTDAQKGKEATLSIYTVNWVFQWSRKPFSFSGPWA
jgi:hypothetical protein